MLTVSEIISSRKRKQLKPGEEELRRLPYKNAFIYGRVSSPRQMKESLESLRGIALLVDIAIEDGYNTALTSAAVSKWITDIREGRAEPGVWVDGQVTVELRDLGLSGRLNDDRRPGFANLQQTIGNDQTGCVYLNEGVSRLSRDEDGITPPVLLKLFREHSCRIRTRRRRLNPCIQRDRDILEEEFRDARKEGHTMDIRMYEGRRDKAADGKYVGGPIIPGFIVEIMETKPSGRRVYGTLQAYPPHAEIVVKILREYIKQGFSKKKTHRALNRLKFPLFPPGLEYMEHLSSLRKAYRTESGYIISPAMIRSLALNLKLIGVWTWGDTEARYDNHDAIVPADLFLEAYDGAASAGKPRGSSIRHEPLEWDGLLWCYNHDTSSRILGNTAKEAYHCQSEYVQGRGPACFHMSAHYLGKPLTEAVLGRLSFTPLAEEVLMQLETDYSHLNLEAELWKKEIAQYEKILKNLEEQLGWEGGVHARVLLKKIQKTENKLEDLKSRPVPARSIQEISYPMVKDFLVGLPDNWYSYSRTKRNRLLQSLIDHVEIRHEWPFVEATICWRTGQKQVVKIRRIRDKGNRESLWSKEEKRLLKMLWLNASQEAVMAALPGRSWLAIRHQAQNMSLKRTPATYRCVPRCWWSPDDDLKAQQDYEAGVPVGDISVELQRSCSAIMQRASEKGWKRMYGKEGGGANSSSIIKQRPTVSKEVSSGSISGGQITFTAGIGPRIFDKHL